MKNYTIKINNNNSGINFRNTNNASKNLNDIILSGIIKMNPYLSSIIKKKSSDTTLDAMFAEAGFTSDRIIIPNRDYSYLLKGNFDSEFAKAAAFLSGYTPKKKTSYIFNDTPIAFFEDEIQIGDILIPLYKLSSPMYYKTFTPEIKNTIINIFISINR